MGDRHNDFIESGELTKPLDLLCSYDLIGDLDVFHSGCSHQLCLTQLGTSNSKGSGVDRELGNFRNLDSLGVRPPFQASRLKVCGQVLDV